MIPLVLATIIITFTITSIFWIYSTKHIIEHIKKAEREVKLSSKNNKAIFYITADQLRTLMLNETRTGLIKILNNIESKQEI